MRKTILFNDRLLIIVIILLALLLRLIDLTRYDLWLDEICVLSRVKINSLWYLSTNFTPFQPLYNLLLTYWRVLGDTPLILRFSSVASGIASVLIIYLVGREVFNKKTGIICAFLLSISPFSIQYSQELRPYSLLILLVLLSTYAYIKLLKKGSFLFWAINITANILSAYLVYTSIFIFLVQLIFIYFHIKKDRIREILLFQSIQLILLLPWFYIAIKYLIVLEATPKIYRQLLPFISSVSINNLFYSFKNFVSGYYAPNNVRIAGSIFFILIMIKGTADLLALSKKQLLMMLLFLLIPILSLFIFSKFRPFYAERYVSYTVVFLYLIIGFAISRLDKTMLFFSILACCLISALSLNNYYSNNIDCSYLERQGTNARKEFRKAAYFLKDNYRQGDLVIHTSITSTLPLEYYLNEDDEGGFLNRNTLLYKFIVDARINNKENTSLIIHKLDRHMFHFYKNRDFFIEQKNDELFDNNERIWLILSAWDDPAQYKVVNDWMKDRYFQKICGKFKGVEIYLYINRRVQSG